ncbi:MAG: hypothetical protein PHY43_11475 [Verrucomicrobiales bacterium]|nr:hypothetical protein [Verrucomicrobiales bacterium]
MKNKHLLLALAGAALFCGCDKQTRINTEKIAVLSQKMVVLQQNQANQLATIQTQLTSLAPMLDKMNNSYFEKSHEDAFFFHTNTLYLLLTVDRKIESELQVADTERQAEHALAYSYHTNQLRTMYLTTAQIEEDLTAQENRITDKVNAGTRQVGADLLNQIKLLAPDKAETARRMEMEADVAQIKRDLDQIKMRLGITNPPPAQP